MPDLPGYEADLVSLTASRLGGDYCDAFPLADGTCVILIGDATGHGVPAALMMAMAKAMIHLAGGDLPDLSGVLQRMSRLFHRLMAGRRLMTFFLSILNPAAHRLVFCNAGHPYPLRIAADGRCDELAAAHPPLGVRQARPFDRVEIGLDPGDVIVLFTDGIYEAVNSREEAFGMGRIRTTVAASRAGSPRRIRDDLLAAVREFTGGAPFADDVTVIVLKRQAGEPAPGGKEAGPHA